MTAPHPEYLSQQCVLASDRLIRAAQRMRAANSELDAAEREHRLACEALDEAERQYYGRPEINLEMLP